MERSSGRSPGYLVVAGPTAVGKSAVALELAQRLDGEIVIADSRQVYRGIDIATAKPSAAERSRVPHHLVDLVALGDRYTAADYAVDADAAIGTIIARGRVPIVCGGTGLYLAALAGALDPIEEAADPAGRARARARVDAIPDEERHAALADVDPHTAARLPRGDRQRIDRALEVWFLTGRSLSSHHGGGREPRPHVAARLVRSRPEILRRIDERLDEMLSAGLEEEARALWEAGRSANEPGLDTIGIQEWWRHFEGGRSRDETIEEIRAATRQYAKRQTTWFRHQGEYRPIPADDAAPSILDLWSRSG
ncbi:MAG TPA: tRNA (adenosine(37)-N6)-dimethylallyltransferase MiaA [Gemmatimonadota bacterium]|nr:tRNA (adenosine(37)-N6)-dimethylallyltransferase MiaA [Gemmatimonadota bacterium]